MRSARRAFADLLADGLDTPGHLVLRVLDEDGPPVGHSVGHPVGHVWLRLLTDIPGTAHLLDIDLDQGVRGRGLGRATMRAAEDVVRRHGATALRLNVFAHNVAALGLYDSLGYAVVGSSLRCSLSGPGPHSSRVVLEEMTPEQYADLRATLREQRPEVDELLPDGPATPGHRLWTAYDGARTVGRVWVQLQHRSDGIHAFVQHLEVGDLEVGGEQRARSSVGPDVRSDMSSDMGSDMGRVRGPVLGPVVLAVQEACRGWGARSMGVEVPGVDVPGHDGRALAVYEDCGFGLIAQTRQRSL